MGAVSVVSGSKDLRVVGGLGARIPTAIRTEAHTLASGVGVRTVRRTVPPQAGFALEALGHAIDYLTDEYAHALSEQSSPRTLVDPREDPRVQAIQILMAANREVYYACPVTPPLYRRLLDRWFRS